MKTLDAVPPGTFLQELISQPPGPSGCYFLDRDGRQFHNILNFLRDGHDLFVVPTDAHACRELYREACFYGLVNLALVIQSAYVGSALPSNEEARLRRLDGLAIMHTDDNEVEYDCITMAVKAILDIPIVLVSLVGEDHQWFKSRCGLDAKSTPKNTSFCAFCFLPEDPEILIIEDAVRDPRTCNNPLVLGEPYIGYYAGAPLVTTDGIRLGALCVIDHKPRIFEAWHYQLLVSFAHLTVQEIQRNELAKTTIPDLFEDPEASSSNGAAARREAWRGISKAMPAMPLTNKGSMMDYGAGPLRLARMKEALSEIVVLVQVSHKHLNWPILYGSQEWTTHTGMQIHSPDFSVCKAENADKFLNWPTIWDFLKFPVESWRSSMADAPSAEEAFLANIREAWGLQDQPHSFALASMLYSVSDRGASVTEDEAARPCSCRFVPVHQPLDIAAAAVKTLAVPTGGPGLAPAPTRPQGFVPENYFYFVILAFSDVLPTAEPSNTEVSSVLSSSNTQQVPSATPGSGALDRQESGPGSDSPVTPVTSNKSAGKDMIGSTTSSKVNLKPARPPFVDVKLNKKVGQGSFGKVYYGQWLGSPVAVKVVEWKGARDKVEPLFEAELSCTLSHPNLVQTFKYDTKLKEQEKIAEAEAQESEDAQKLESEEGEGVYQTWIVQEWCDLGTLRTLCNHPRDSDVGYIESLRMCIEITSAGSYLHSRGIIHGDLTANNVLCKSQPSVVKNYVCKICDFGLARILEGENDGIWTNQLGTVTHMPPELFRMDCPLVLTTKADVYATGILLWQAICGKDPFAGLVAAQVVVQIAKGKRLELPPLTPPCIVELFQRCTASEPDERPSMDELAECLVKALDTLEAGAG
jgi:GAF domain-containing protein